MRFKDWCKTHPRFMGVDITVAAFAMILWIFSFDTTPPKGMLLGFTGSVGLILAITLAAWLVASDGFRTRRDSSSTKHHPVSK